jgi:chromosome segregation ATPase
LQNEFASLQCQPASLQNELAPLESQLTSLKNELASLQNEPASLQNEFAPLRNELASLQTGSVKSLCKRWNRDLQKFFACPRFQMTPYFNLLSSF